MPGNDNKTKKTPKHKRSAILDWLGYAALRLVVFIMSLFSVRSNLHFACFLGRLLWRYYHRGRNRALENLRASWPEKDQDWLIQTGRRSFEQLAMLAVDVMFTHRLLRQDNWQDYFTFRNIERVKWMMKEKPGVLMVTGHYANFEIMGYLLGLFGFNIYSIARPLDNPYISRYLYGIREGTGQKIIDKKGASVRMEKLAAEGATLCFIADQDAGRKGVFVDFFGRKASSYKSIALVAIQYNMPVVVGCSRRLGNRFFFEIEAVRIITPDQWLGQADPIKWITGEYNRAIEEFVRRDPTQYWWLHRRWKTRPKEEQNTAQQQNNGGDIAKSGPSRKHQL